jgi:hypothetical protein
MAVGGGVAKSDGRRSVFCAGDRGGAVGQGRNARALSGEHVAAMHPKGAHRAVTPVSELREDLFQTAVGPGDRAATWDRPRCLGPATPAEGGGSLRRRTGSALCAGEGGSRSLQLDRRAVSVSQGQRKSSERQAGSSFDVLSPAASTLGPIASASAIRPDRGRIITVSSAMSPSASSRNRSNPSSSRSPT